jgi:predicted RNase H-like nuclease (RuvC/YqgF family)
MPEPQGQSINEGQENIPQTEETQPQQTATTGTVNAVSVVETGPPITLSRADVNIEIETQLTRQLNRVAAWVISTVLAIVLGGIITAIWTMNRQVGELSGKYSSPETIINHLSDRLEKMEKENDDMKAKIHEIEIQDLKDKLKKVNEELKKLKGKNQN